MSYAAAGLAANAGKYQEMQVLAASPGENAWLVHVERFLRARRPTIPTLLREAGG